MGKILFVDDDESALDALCAMARRWGHEVRGLNDSRQTMAAVQELRPDVVVLDWQMPGVDGPTVLRMLRDDPDTEALPIIMLTGARTNDMFRDTAVKAGANEYLLKPIDSSILKDRLEQFMDPQTTQRKGEIQELRSASAVLSQVILNALGVIARTTEVLAEEARPEEKPLLGTIRQKIDEIHNALGRLRAVQRVTVSKYVGVEEMLDVQACLDDLQASAGGPKKA